MHCKHLILRAPNWLGDAIMAQPAMHAFASGVEAEHIWLSGRPWLADILPWMGLPKVEYAPEGSRGGDICVLFPNSFRSAWQAMKTGCARRIGYRGQWRRLLLTDPLTPHINLRTGHHREYYNDLARLSGIPVANPEVELVCPEGAKAAGEQWLLERGLHADKVLCIAPGAQFGGAKRYPAASWTKVAKLLLARGFHLLALGTPGERDIADEVLGDCGQKTLNAAGETTLTECLQLIAASRGLLCNDSGLMHVAAGLGKPVVAVFGATDPARTSPSGPNVRLLYHPAACSPCLQRECSVDGHPCMGNINPEEVAMAVVEQA